MYWWFVYFMAFALIVGEVTAYSTHDFGTISQAYAKFRSKHQWLSGFLFGLVWAALAIHFSGWEN